MKITRTAAAALAASAALALTGCGAPGWQGERPISELELMEPEREGSSLDHEGLEVTVLDGTTERSVHVQDCELDALRLGQVVSVTDVEDACDSTVGWSQDD